MRAYRPSQFPDRRAEQVVILKIRDRRVRLYALRVEAGLPLFEDGPAKADRSPARPSRPRTAADERPVAEAWV